MPFQFIIVDADFFFKLFFESFIKFLLLSFIPIIEVYQFKKNGGLFENISLFIFESKFDFLKPRYRYLIV